MRLLFVTRGIPGSGKSTFLREQGLTPYTLSPDELRLLFSTPQLTTEGRLVMPSRQDRAVWQLLNEKLEERMARGETTVVDATHTASSYFTHYVKLCQKYRYRLVVIDFAAVPLEQCRWYNQQRPEHKVVDEAVLEKMHRRLQSCRLPRQATVVRSAEEFQAVLANQYEDVGRYRKIHHIGDIQGCYEPLKEYFQRYPLRDDELYIFVGDLLDRGTENDQVLHFVCEELLPRQNVLFVEGNHDLYLWQWATGQSVTSREFNGRTRQQLERAGIDKQLAVRLMRRMREYVLYEYSGRTVLVTHGGLSTLPPQLALLSTDQLVRGVGRYEEVGAVDDAFVRQTPEQTFQIHGHRNQQHYPLRYNERCFNLEGKVEFGGELRAVQLDADGFQEVVVPHHQSELRLYPENAPLLHQLRTNRHIRETVLPGNISSFHFKPEVFYKQTWTAQTMRARGLFINTLTHDIVIRGYDKFFNIGERRDTELASLAETMAFPVQAWVKENGYLGLVGYDEVLGELVISSKSTTEGEYAETFRRAFRRQYRAQLAAIAEYLREQHVCLLFEVILPVFDPHIIEYHKDQLVLLEIVERQAQFAARDETECQAFIQRFGGQAKRQAATFTSWQEFVEWYEKVRGMSYRLDGKPVEGFVIEDARGRRWKVKGDYYSFWRHMRTALEAMQAGRSPKLRDDCPDPPLAQRVVAYMRGLSTEELAGMTIIALRRRFERSENP